MRRLVPGGTGALALLAGALVLLSLTSADLSSARERPSTALYYETQTSTGQLAIDRLNLVGPPTSTQVVALPSVGVFGITLGGPFVYWVTEAGPRDRGAIMRATPFGEQVRTLVGGLPAPNSVIAVGGFIYWSDQHAIGRVALDGSRLQRHFLVLPQEAGGGVADGLASDGAHLYFSRCSEDAIGRVGLNRARIDLRFISTPHCPQGLAIASGHVYWTQLGSGTIGRARLDGRDANGRWLNIHSNQGPFQVAADGDHVYWTWGGVDGSPSYTGRADADGAHRDRRFLADSLYPLALSAGG